MSALFKPIASGLGLTRTATSVAPGIGKLVNGPESLLTGWLSDRFGPKWIIIIGVFLLGLGLVLMNFINSLWALYIVWGVILGTGFSIALAVPLDTAITNWFVKKRGTALSIKWAFFGLSGVLVLPLISWLITVQGWRMTCVIGGLVMWIIGLPLVSFLLKQHRPEHYGLLPDGATVEGEVASSQMIDRGIEYTAEVEEVEFTHTKQAMKTPAFWLLIVAAAGQDLVRPAMSVHCIPFLTDIGVNPLKAAGMMAIIALVSIPARLVGGVLADRVKKNYLRFLLTGAMLLQAAGMAIFLLNQTLAMIYVWFTLYGIGMGVTLMLIPIMRGRYFGRKRFGSIHGSSMLLTPPIAVVSSIYAGWVYDTSGSYIPAFTLFAALLALSAVFLFFTKPPKPPAQVADIRRIA